jgi:hypothetical protein
MSAVKFLAGYGTFVTDRYCEPYWIPERLLNKIQRLWQRLAEVENRGAS